MKTLLISAAVIALLFGTVGVSVAAAKANEPGDPFYGLKTWAEGIQLQARVETQTSAQEQLRLTPEIGAPVLGQDGTQLREQDRLQDQDQDQDRLQERDRDRLHDQDCLQECDQDRLQDQNRLQERDQDRIHQTDPTDPGNNNGNGSGPNPNKGGNGRP
jgi:hypothetical protein